MCQLKIGNTAASTVEFMYYKKLTIGVAALMLAIVTVRAECTDPNDPDCATGTNTPPVYTPHAYTNGELYLIAGRSGASATITLTNASLLEDYVIEASSDLITWTTAVSKFEADTDGSALFVLSPTNSAAYYRARVATYVGYANLGSASGSFSCGSYIGYGNYYGFEGSWGYTFEPGMSRHIIYDGSGKTNRIVSYLGRVGDHGCGTYQCDVIAAGSLGYRATLFAVSGETLPQSNQPMRFKGMAEDFDSPRGVNIDGPGVNAQGFFY